MQKFLSLFVEIERKEVPGVLLMTLNIFLIMTAYYVVKTVREPLVLAGETAALFEGGGAEIKSYLAAAQAVVLIAAVPAYGLLVDRMKRFPLLATVTGFFIVCIEIFFVCAQLEVPYLGIPFYIWVGIFNLAVIAQFWSLANDLYTKEQGERLFAFLALGMTAGAAAGSKIADLLFDSGIGPFTMLQVSAALLGLSLGLYAISLRRITPAEREDDDEGDDDGPVTNGFMLILKNPYIRWIAALFLLLNLVNTTGEFILSTLVETRANEVAEGDVGEWIGSFYGDFYFWVNIGAIAVQGLLVSRMVKYGGLAAVLFALPIVSLGTYGMAAAGVGLGIWRWFKTAENLTDYSVMNTAKAMLWLPTSREEKYKAKAAIDTFVVRAGDVGSAVLVFVGLNLLDFGPVQFGMANVVVVLLWLFVSWRVLSYYRQADA